jgi:hypothetical protein
VRLVQVDKRYVEELNAGNMIQKSDSRIRKWRREATIFTLYENSGCVQYGAELFEGHLETVHDERVAKTPEFS